MSEEEFWRQKYLKEIGEPDFNPTWRDLYFYTVSNNIFVFGNGENGQLGLGYCEDKTEPTQLPFIKGLKVSGGSFHSLILDLQGAVWVFGEDISYFNSLYRPVPIPDLKAKDISAGVFLSLILDTSGNVWLVSTYLLDAKDWKPIKIPLSVEIKGIAAGNDNGFLLDVEGAVWVVNQQGEFSKIDEPLCAKSISASRGHVLILDSHSNVLLSKENEEEQLGLGYANKNGRFVFTRVPFPENVKLSAVSAGNFHSLALDSEEGVWVFGSNEVGQLGLGDTVHRYSPVRINGIKAKAISAGGGHSLILDLHSNVLVFGDNNYGQLGLGKVVPKSLIPTLLPGIKAKSISAGERHSLIITREILHPKTGDIPKGDLGLSLDVVLEIASYLDLEDIIAFSQVNEDLKLILYNNEQFWKGKYLKELGEPDFIPSWRNMYFYAVSNNLLVLGDLKDRTLSFLKAKKASAGHNHGLIIDLQDNVWSFGNNKSGQLGIRDDSYNEWISPTKINDIKAKDVSASEYSSLILDLEGNVWLAGYTTFTDSTSFVQIPSIKAKAISANLNNCYIVDIEGNIWVFGHNNYGELGLGDRNERIKPTQIPGLKAETISSKAFHVLVLTPERTVWAFGINKNGQLGLGNTDDQIIPVRVPGLPPCKSISAGVNHSLIIDLDGNVWSFGSSKCGQYLPVQISGLPHAKAISAGCGFSLVLDTDDNVWALGKNQEELNTPTKIQGVKARNISVGFTFILIVTSY